MGNFYNPSNLFNGFYRLLDSDTNSFCCIILLTDKLELNI